VITDPLFYAVAIPGVLLVGLSKGGFGGSISLLAIPLMSLVISPIQAAGIMLPILLVMDAVGLTAYRRIYHLPALKILLPAAVIGIIIGWLTAAWVTASHVRLIVGIVALLFTIDYWRGGASREPAKESTAKGSFWGLIAGFTSFVSHAGGPPFQMYMLPLRLDPRHLAGTAIIFFASVNAIKVIPYFFLGQFDARNLATSAVLLPLAPIATLTGVWLVKRIEPSVFYRVTYSVVFLVSLKLIWDGLRGVGVF